MKLTAAPGKQAPGSEHLNRRSEVLIDFDLDRQGAPAYAGQNPEFKQSFWFDRDYSSRWSQQNNEANSFRTINATGGQPAARVVHVRAPATAGATQGGLNFGDSGRAIVPNTGSEILLPRFPGKENEDLEAFYFSALIRKANPAVATHFAEGVSILHGGPGGGFVVGNLANDPRVGLIGDGLQGYGFGSAGCPNGVVVPAAPAFRDAGFVQPAQLVNPGSTFFKVALKIIPAGLGRPMAVACYLDDTLISVFSTLTNLPRGRSNNAQYNFGGITPVITSAQEATVQASGLFVKRVHYYYTTDMST